MELIELTGQELLKKYDVVIPKDELNAIVDAKAIEAASTIKLPGFRAGKVPTSMIKAQHKDHLEREALEHFIKLSIKDAETQNNLKLLSQPMVDEVKFDANNGLRFTIEVEFSPEVPALSYKDINVTRYTCEVDEEALSNTRKSLQKKYRTLTTLPNTTKAKAGHVVEIDVITTVDGTEVPDSKVTEMQIELGEEEFLPGVDAALTGAHAGEEKVVTVTLPETYHKQELKGKEATLNVSIKSVSKVELPEVDDALVQKEGIPSVQEFEKQASESIKGWYGQLAYVLAKKELFDRLDTAVSIPLPPKMLDAERKALSAQGNLSQDEIEKLSARRVKLGLIISKTAQDNNIRVTEQEFKARIISEVENMQRMYSIQVPIEHVVKYYQETPGALQKLESELIENKVVHFLLNQVSSVEQNIAPKELQKLFEGIR
jgi:trigger factor